MKKFLEIAVLAVLSIAIAYGSIYISDMNDDFFSVNSVSEKSLLAQKVEGYDSVALTYYKVYSKGNFIGIITDLEYVNSLIDKTYHEDYEQDFPDTSMTFGEDVYIMEVSGFYRVENIDDKIFEYLKNNMGLGIYTNVIDFSTNDGIYASIYVEDINDFYDARDLFLENFISSEELYKLSNNQHPSDLTSVGTQSIAFRVQEKITAHKGVVHPSKVMMNMDEVLEYLCFGENEERSYHVVKDGETLQGVGFNYGDMTPTQIMMLNKYKITSVDQILEEGMILNVTYFTSPITVVVTKERLTIEDVYPDTPLYIEDNTLYEGTSVVQQKEENGSAYALYEEIWVNGYLLRGTKKSESIITQPVQGIIQVGSKVKPNVGSGFFRWPIDNPMITCSWYCYPGHQALDLQNMYNRYDNIYAADNGTVITNSYDDISGYYVVIDHNNGYQTYYGHMYRQSTLKVGDTVLKGEIIGTIGATGLATGPHVHFEIRVDGVKKDVCDYTNCDALPRG